jgi:hypothetical protein
MAKPKRSAKLKVFRTPIGFHDAYVAAPSQKAALEAWGTGTNLFANGAAEQVTDPELTKVPLENPGQVVKVLRGTKAEQLAALAKQKPPKRTASPKAEVLPKPAKKRPPRPSRAPLEKAQAALEKLEERQERERVALDRQLKELERRRSELQRRHEREHDKACSALQDAREEYEAALSRYESA